jgi:hypothetical protein
MVEGYSVDESPLNVSETETNPYKFNYSSLGSVEKENRKYLNFEGM